MKKYILSILMFMGLFILSACGTGGSDNISNTDTGSVISGDSVIQVKTNEMIIKDDTFILTMSFVKEVDSSYKIELSNFELSSDSCILDQKPIFTPDVVHLDGGINSYAMISASGTFDQNCSATSYTLSTTQKTTKDGKIDTRVFSVTHDSQNSNINTGSGFFNATTPVEITQPDTSYEIKAQIIKDGLIESGATIKMKPFDSQYGSLSNYEVLTGEDGYAVFKYTSPEALPLNDTSTIIEMIYDDNGTILTQNIVLHFSNSGTVAEYNLTNVTSPIIINQDSELKTISVKAIDGNGVGQAGIDVSITAINGVQYGSIISASTVKTDASGRADFTYKAPENVAAVNHGSTSIDLFLISNGIKVSANVTIEFNKIEEDVSIPFVVISNNNKKVNLTQNRQAVSMEVKVFNQSTNAPYTSGQVKVALPQEILEGVDVGRFSAYSVDVGDDGIATFNYEGPQDLQGLIDNNNTYAVFKFYHEENPTQSEDIRVDYTPENNYIPASYLLSLEGNQTMGLDILGQFVILLKDDQGNLISDSQIKEMTIKTKNEVVGKLIDANHSGAEVVSLSFSDNDASNGKSFSVKTYTVSGLLPIEVVVNFIDGNGNSQTRTIITNITVFSGPPTAMSISYAGVEQNSTIAKYIEKFVVTVTDAYNNPVNTRPYIAVGAMVEYAVDGSSQTGERTTTSPRLWHGRLDSRGELEAVGGNKAQFTTTVDAFNYIDLNNDKLVVFGDGYVYESLGKWDIESVSSQVLGLKDDYFGITRSDLYFAVGHNNRQDLCSVDGRQYVGNMKAESYQLDETGHALVEFEYDYHLTGKDIMIWTNLTGFQADSDRTGRIGESKKHTLRGAGFTSPERWKVEGYGAPRTLSFTVHHENAPEWYRNGHFGFIVTGACTVHGILDWSNFYDARDCHNTVGYVDLNVSNPSKDECTITIDNINVSPEFNGVTYP